MGRDPDCLKALEFAQSIIARLAGNSFTIKSWSVALATAIFAFAMKDARPKLALLALFPTAIFWLLDAYYMTIEQGYRDVFKRIADGDEKTFDLAAPDFDAALFAEKLRSWPVVLAHLVPLAGAVLIATLAR